MTHLSVPLSPIVNERTSDFDISVFEGFLQKSDKDTSRRVFCVLSQEKNSASLTLRCYANEKSRHGLQPLNEFPLSLFRLVAQPSSNLPKSFALRSIGVSSGEEREVTFSCATNSSKADWINIMQGGACVDVNQPTVAPVTAAVTTTATTPNSNTSELFPTKLAMRLARQSSPALPNKAATTTTSEVDHRIGFNHRSNKPQRSRSASPRASSALSDKRSGSGWVSPMFGNRTHSSRRFSGDKHNTSAHTNFISNTSPRRVSPLASHAQRHDIPNNSAAVKSKTDGRGSGWVAPMFGNKTHSSRRFSPERRAATPHGQPAEHSQHLKIAAIVASSAPIDDISSDTSSSDGEGEALLLAQVDVARKDQQISDDLVGGVDISRVSSLSSSRSASSFARSPPKKSQWQPHNVPSMRKVSATDNKSSAGNTKTRPVKFANGQHTPAASKRSKDLKCHRSPSTGPPITAADRAKASRRAFVAAASLNGASNGYFDMFASRIKTPESQKQKQLERLSRTSLANAEYDATGSNYVAEWLAKHTMTTPVSSSPPQRNIATDLFRNSASAQSPTKTTAPSRFKTPDELKTQRPKDADRIDLLTDAAEWSRLLAWLKRMNLQKYAGVFRSAGVTKLSVIELLQEDDLKQLQIETNDISRIVSSVHEMSKQTKTFAELALTPTASALQSNRSQQRSFGADFAAPINASEPAVYDRNPDVSQRIISQLAARTMQLTLLRHFDEGNRAAFADLWEQMSEIIRMRCKRAVAEDRLQKIEETFYSLEFYCNVYFAVYPMRAVSTGQSAPFASAEEAVREYRLYLDSLSGRDMIPALAALCKSRVFAAYAGLAIVPDPRSNPAYGTLFDIRWSQALRSKLTAFLNVCAAAKILPERRETTAANAAEKSDDVSIRAHTKPQQHPASSERTATASSVSRPQRRVSALLGSGGVVFEDLSVAASFTRPVVDMSASPTANSASCSSGPPEPNPLPLSTGYDFSSSPTITTTSSAPEPTYPPPIITPPTTGSDAIAVGHVSNQRRRASALLGSGPVSIICDEEEETKAATTTENKISLSRDGDNHAVDTSCVFTPPAEILNINEDNDEDANITTFIHAETVESPSPEVSAEMPVSSTLVNTAKPDEDEQQISPIEEEVSAVSGDDAHVVMAPVILESDAIKATAEEVSHAEDFSVVIAEVISGIISSAELLLVGEAAATLHLPQKACDDDGPEVMDSFEENPVAAAGSGGSYLKYLKSNVRGLNGLNAQTTPLAATVSDSVNHEYLVDGNNDRGTAIGADAEWSEDSAGQADERSQCDDIDEIRLENPFLAKTSSDPPPAAPPAAVSHPTKKACAIYESGEWTENTENVIADVDLVESDFEASEAEEEARDEFDIFGSSNSLTRFTPPPSKRYVRSQNNITDKIKQFSPASLESVELQQYQGWTLEGSQWVRKIPACDEEKSIAEAFYSDENLALVPANSAEISRRRASMHHALQSITVLRRNALSDRSPSSRLMSRGYSNAEEEEDDEEALEYTASKLKDLAPFAVRRASLTTAAAMTEEQQQHSEDRYSNATPQSETGDSVDNAAVAVRAVMRVVEIPTEKHRLVSSESMQLADSYQASPFAEEISSTHKQLYDVL